ncbi:MAG: cupin domain-containing protein [Ruminococcaceae bacterium]|nr:cupin domain-containing protein [Oscillospiraceae bacterium]
MIKRQNEFTSDLRESMRGGNGVVELKNFASTEDMNNKGRMFGTITLKPGCSIGWHVHEKDSELFYILKGTAKYSDNGNEATVNAGDVTYCPAGTGHSIENIGDDNVELVALIVYA